MTFDSIETLSPFQPSAPDEQIELDALAFALQAAQGYRLIFARCHEAAQRQRLIAALKKRVPELETHSLEIVFDTPIYSLLDELRARLDERSPKALFIAGLEHSMPQAESASQTPLVANLNASRELFQQVVPCPLVLWVSDYVLSAILQGAPDFISVRSGIYYFSDADVPTLEPVRSLTGTKKEALGNLPLKARLERIRTIEGLLAVYAAFSPVQREEVTETRLRKDLAHLYLQTNQLENAERILIELLDDAKRRNDRDDEAAIQTLLGVLSQQQGDLVAASQRYRQSALLFQEVEDANGEAGAWVNAASVLAEQEQWQEVEAACLQSLSLARRTGSLLGEAIALDMLGYVHAQQQHYEEAERFVQDAVALFQKLNASAYEAAARVNLGRIHFQQHHWQAAEREYRQALNLQRSLYEQHASVATLTDMAGLYTAQSRHAEAALALEQALQLSHSLGDRIGEAGALQGMALASMSQGDFSQAVELQQRAVDLFDALPYKRTDSARTLLSEMKKRKDTQ